jgi:putative FmdB family regulatory protein
MPIYEYRCEKGHTFEVTQRISEAALETCERCDAPAARVLHAPAVHFKGSGFYNTDYGTRKRAREKGAENEGKSGDGKGGSEKKDSEKKPDAKSDGGGKKTEGAAA